MVILILNEVYILLCNVVHVIVLVMALLNLLSKNVIFDLLVAALTAGIGSGMSLSEATDILVDGMANQSGTALSYILLGIFAVMIGMSGITTILVNKMLKVFSNKRIILVLSIAGIGIFSQNLVPVHIERKSTRLNSSHVAISYAVFC